MSISDISIDALQGMNVTPGVQPARPKLHRIRTVRRQQGVSMRRVAHELGVETRLLREEEDEATDLRLSRVYAWQSVLDVPLAELLVEGGSALSAPVLERARMVRIMKTVAAILDKTENQGIRRLAQMLAEQLCEIMPELEGISPWHSVGKRRSTREYGRIVEQVYSENVWRAGE